MENGELFPAILDSLLDPVLVADTAHKVIYMNRAAIAHYDEGVDLMGSDLLKCHNDASQEMMFNILAEMRNGLIERLITDDDDRQIFMRAVHDDEGTLIGYYERYVYKSKTSEEML